jgi:hypothetical protein
VRPVGADLSDLLIIHKKQFPANELGVWTNANGIVAKVSHAGEIPVVSFSTAITSINYIFPVEV